MNILVKFPTRERPDKFFSVLDVYIKQSKLLSKIGFLISMDTDDYSMNNDHVKTKLNTYITEGIKLVYYYSNNNSKVQAINANISNIDGWDILLLASDDMIPIQNGYDEIIRTDMYNNFLDTDGVLWYNDGGQSNINTLCILGKKYYNRFGYIYHPDYISLWCDNEFTDISIILNKVYRSEQVIIEHAHPVYQKCNYDQLYLKNESFNNHDKQTYLKRKSLNFNL
jgi:hypothetical protein